MNIRDVYRELIFFLTNYKPGILEIQNIQIIF